jgi:hypothetical protein
MSVKKAPPEWNRPLYLICRYIDRYNTRPVLNRLLHIHHDPAIYWPIITQKRFLPYQSVGRVGEYELYTAVANALRWSS